MFLKGGLCGGEGEREGAGRSGAFVDTNTGIMSLRRPVKCPIYCLHLLIRPFSALYIGVSPPFGRSLPATAVLACLENTRLKI